MQKQIDLLKPQRWFKDVSGRVKTPFFAREWGFCLPNFKVNDKKNGFGLWMYT